VGDTFLFNFSFLRNLCFYQPEPVGNPVSMSSYCKGIFKKNMAKHIQLAISRLIPESLSIDLISQEPCCCISAKEFRKFSLSGLLLLCKGQNYISKSNLSTSPFTMSSEVDNF